MTNPDLPEQNDTSDLILDRLYEIALEPAALDDFIDLWHDLGLDMRYAPPDPDRETRGFDDIYGTHLSRAQMIQQRDDTARPDLADLLKPYDNLAAFVVGPALKVLAANSGALRTYGAKPGDALDQLCLPAEFQSVLGRTVQEVLGTPARAEKLLRTDMADRGDTVLFRVMRLTASATDGPAVMVVSTHFHWRDTISALLGNVFQLTQAEQDIVRLLVQGKDAKTIAQIRKTSEGTARGQLKSILSKMNLRSQTDIIRLVMTLGEFPKGMTDQEDDSPNAQPSQHWLEAEVWKPFKSVTLPDGRILTYHDMGPPTGHPVLMTHMGSCMVRWPRSMLRLAFAGNLRVICPIRAGYGYSTPPPAPYDPLQTASDDMAHLLRHLGIARLPLVAQGTDFPFAADMAERHPGMITALIGVGARPCLPGGAHLNAPGRWQRFFVSTARHAPHLVQFASRAVMAMSKRIGAKAMLRQLCKESAADLALLQQPATAEVLEANLELMAGKSTNAAQAFASEFIAFQQDWSGKIEALRDLPVRIFLAEQDPTIDIADLARLSSAYPWMQMETVPDAGLALMYQIPAPLITHMAQAAKQARAPR